MERGAKIGTINRRMPRGLRVVDIFAFRAIELDELHPRYIGKTCGDEMCCGAVDARAFAEFTLFVFVDLENQSQF